MLKKINTMVWHYNFKKSKRKTPLVFATLEFEFLSKVWEKQKFTIIFDL